MKPLLFPLLLFIKDGRKPSSTSEVAPFPGLDQPGWIPAFGSFGFGKGRLLLFLGLPYDFRIC